jgi:hypothetical protein
MAAALFSWLSEKPIANSAKVGETDICRTPFDSNEDLIKFGIHNDIINDTKVKRYFLLCVIFQFNKRLERLVFLKQGVGKISL